MSSPPAPQHRRYKNPRRQKLDSDRLRLQLVRYLPNLRSIHDSFLSRLQFKRVTGNVQWEVMYFFAGLKSHSDLTSVGFEMVCSLVNAHPDTLREFRGAVSSRKNLTPSRTAPKHGVKLTKQQLFSNLSLRVPDLKGRHSIIVNRLSTNRTTGNLQRDVIDFLSGSRPVSDMSSAALQAVCHALKISYTTTTKDILSNMVLHGTSPEQDFTPSDILRVFLAMADALPQDQVVRRYFNDPPENDDELTMDERVEQHRWLDAVKMFLSEDYRPANPLHEILFDGPDANNGIQHFEIQGQPRTRREIQNIFNALDPSSTKMHLQFPFEELKSSTSAGKQLQLLRLLNGAERCFRCQFRNIKQLVWDTKQECDGVPSTDIRLAGHTMDSCVLVLALYNSMTTSKKLEQLIEAAIGKTHAFGTERVGGTREGLRANEPLRMHDHQDFVGSSSHDGHASKSRHPSPSDLVDSTILPRPPAGQTNAVTVDVPQGKGHSLDWEVKRQQLETLRFKREQLLEGIKLYKELGEEELYREALDNYKSLSKDGLNL